MKRSPEGYNTTSGYAHPLSTPVRSICYCNTDSQTDNRDSPIIQFFVDWLTIFWNAVAQPRVQSLHQDIVKNTYNGQQLDWNGGSNNGIISSLLLKADIAYQSLMKERESGTDEEITLFRWMYDGKGLMGTNHIGLGLYWTVQKLAPVVFQNFGAGRGNCSHSSIAWFTPCTEVHCSKILKLWHLIL